MADEKSTGYGLVVSFSGLYPTMEQERAFVDGVEFGGLWERMRSGREAEIETTIRTTNRTVIERSAASQGWRCEFTSTECPEWLFLKVTKTAPETRNPHGLRVVAST